MRKEILEVMRRHNVQMFNFHWEDLWTCVLETDKPVTNDCLKELKDVIFTEVTVKNKVITPVSVVPEQPGGLSDPPIARKRWQDVLPKAAREFWLEYMGQEMTPELFEQAFIKLCQMTEKEKLAFVLYEIVPITNVSGVRFARLPDETI